MSKQPSAFVPNSFQTPNAYVDDLMPYLTGEEYKVLIYAVRRILGFQKRQDRISISQFINGTSHGGLILDQGTGLSIGTVKKCLASLVEFGLMVRLAENDPRTNEGTLWSLQWDYSDVGWDALHDRLEKWDKVNAERIAKARSVRQTPPSETELPPVSGTDGRGSSGTEIQKTGLEIQRNTEEDISLKAKSLLEKITDLLKPQMKRNDFTYLRSARAVSFENHILTLVVCDETTRAWLDDRLASTINRAFPGLGVEASVRFVVGEVA